MRMTKKITSIVLAVMMVVSMMSVMAVTANAEVGDYVAEEDYLTFTAETAGSTVTLKVNSGGSNLQYDLNGAGLTGYTAGTTITLANVGDYVRFRGKDTKFGYSNHVTLTGKVACSGNVMSLRLDDNGRDQGLSNYCFESMFEECTGLTSAPELPETDLKDGCYGYMFYGCTNLTTAPELPATMLAERCYSAMFSGCGNLTTAPQLPATTLARYCYTNMFSGCGRLTTAPELPATSLAPYCYGAMFAGCTSLTTAPELPATDLEQGCYSRMFYGCSSIKLSETQTAEYGIPYSVPSGGNGTTASNALDNMFTGTGGTFTGTPEINKTYYRPAKKYTVTWNNYDDSLIYSEDVAEGETPAFSGENPTKAEDANYTYTFAGWSPEITAVTGDTTYTATFTAVEKGLSGSGTEADPYLIASAEDFRDYLTKNQYTNADGEKSYIKLTNSFTAIKQDGNSAVWLNKNTVLDLNGCILNFDSAFLYVGNDTKLTVNDGTDSGKITATWTSYGNCVVKGNSATSSIEINGGTFEFINQTGNTISNDIISSFGEYTINGGTFNNGAWSAISCGYYTTSAVINGGTFDGNIYVWAENRTVYINGGEFTSINCGKGTVVVSGGTFGVDPSTLTNVTIADGYKVTATDNNRFAVVQHTHAYTTPSFNWTQDAAGDWTCDTLTLSCPCGDSQDYPVTGFFGASVVTCTANADGSFTYSVSKKVDGVTYSDTKTLEANSVVKSATQLKAAAKKGGSWELGNDIDQVVGISCADGFVLDGNDYTVTRHTNVATNPVFVAANKNASFTLENLTIDGIADQTEVRPAIASAQSGVNTGNVINLNNVKITNWDFDADNNGAVLAWGYATVNMDNCDIDTDSTYDVWVGSKGTVDIAGGDTGNVYLHSYSGTGAQLYAAGGADIDKITLDTTVTSTLKADIGRATVGAIEANGDIPSEVVVIDPSVSSVNAPDGYEWAFSKDEGRKTLAPIDPENPLQGKAQIIGYQNKAVQADAEGNGVRILTKIDRDWFEANADEYGYVVAKVQGKDMTANFSNMTKDGGNGEKTIDCTGTYNNGIDGIDNTYVTLAVNGMSDTDQVAARFYVVVNGVTYYANYINTISYDGIIATYTA